MPDNPFRAYREQQTAPAANPFRTYREQQAEEPSANYVAREFASRRFLNNAMAIPSASGELLADTISGGKALVGKAARAGYNNARALVGMERTPNPSLRERFDEAQSHDTIPQRLLRNIPRPTLEDVSAVTGSIPSLLPGGETPGEAMERNRSDYQREEFELRDAHPVAATAGDVGGDVLSMVVGRRGSGSGRAIQRLETRLAGKTGADVAESLSGDLNSILTGRSMQRLARGGVRSLESGVEAAALDILKDPNADPTETAALAAGGQLVGSGVLSTAKGLVSGGPASAGLKLSIAAVSTAGLLQVLKSTAPGGRDRVLESIESGYDKVALALGLGVASAAIGATRYGRGNINLSEQTRTLLDGIGTVHRGTTLSLLTDWTEGDDDEKAAIERVLTGMSNDPTYKGETDAERSIVRRIRSGAGLQRYRTGGGF